MHGANEFWNVKIFRTDCHDVSAQPRDTAATATSYHDIDDNNDNNCDNDDIEATTAATLTTILQTWQEHRQ